jgi:hypothetical protein
VLQGHKEFKARSDPSDLRVRLDLLAQLVPQVQEAILERLVLLAPLELLEPKVFKGFEVLRDLLEPPDSKVRKEIPDQLAQREIKATLEQLVLKVSRAFKVL